MHVVIGTDHRGIKPKEFVKKVLAETGHTVEDVGSFTEDSVDYPDIALKVAKEVASGKADAGILICDTGIGMSIAANKVNGVRAALCYDTFCATRARQHNDANILCIGGRQDENATREIVGAFLSTTFEGGRHQRRVEKISAMEED
ncbi:MAG: ribose 5-phosphate isomerase B [Chloroflexi bacterium RBG_16_57_8]|nr:MAG: ribose 5-phosphate isomerase B [Chloroflexi bacterium RBG_16_57_8]